jgi:hypothetical protein
MNEEASSPHYPNAPQLPPIQHSPSFSFRGPGNPDFRDKTTYDESLYPRALSVRSSTASYNGSLSGSQKGRTSYQDPPNQRVSWQNLNNSSRSPKPSPQPSPQPQYTEPALREQPQQYFPPPSFHAELDSTERLPRTTYHQPPAYGVAELE